MKKKKKARDWEPTKKQKIVAAIIFLLILIVSVGSCQHTINNPVIIRENRINIHMHQEAPVDWPRGIFSVVTGGYEVLFDDVINIELLSHSVTQLSNMIDSLDAPSLRRGYSPNFGSRQTVAGYVSNRSYRLHVSLFPDAIPTIWITRYAGVPVLLSFRYGHETEALYEQIVEAWERWQAS